MPRNAPLEEVMGLLRQAIAILDAEGEAPELAACVQEALDRVRAFVSA